MFETPHPGQPSPTDNGRIPQLRRELRSWTRDLAVALGLTRHHYFSISTGEGGRHQHGAAAERSGANFYQQVCLSI